MKIAIYARVSTKDHQSNSMQINDLREYARLRKWNVVRVFEEVKSGVSARRPKYSELLKEARQRKFDGILVWKIDRWGRSSRDIINSLYELQELGVSFISFNETIDFSTSHGRAMAQLIAVFANLERDLIGERVKAGVANAKKNGRIVGRPKKINEKHIAKAKQLQSEGYSHSKIMSELELGRGTIYKILGPSQIKEGRPKKNNTKYENEIFKERLNIDEIKDLPALIQEKTHYAEITDDEPLDEFDREVEADAEYRMTENGVYEEYSHEKNIRLHHYFDFSDGNDDEYWRVRKYVFERQQLEEERGWNSGAIRKFLGSPNFVVYNKGYMPAHYWFKRDVIPFENSPDFKIFLEKSKKAQEQKKKIDEQKREKAFAAQKLKQQKEQKKIEEYKKSKQKNISKVAEIELNLSIENNSKFVRMRGKVLKEIQTYVLRSFDYKIQNERTFILRVPYKSEKDLDETMEELLQEIWETADLKNCFSESSAVEIDGERSW
jgi:DNA invertase Pin-like site-specific DNA recombinase